jgi:hypothetical protein
MALHTSLLVPRILRWRYRIFSKHCNSQPLQGAEAQLVVLCFNTTFLHGRCEETTSYLAVASIHPLYKIKCGLYKIVSLFTKKMHYLSKNSHKIATSTCFSTPIPSSGGVLGRVTLRTRAANVVS